MTVKVTAEDLQRIADLAEVATRLEMANWVLPPVASDSPHRKVVRELATARTRARARLDAFIDKLSEKLNRKVT